MRYSETIATKMYTRLQDWLAQYPHPIKAFDPATVDLEWMIEVAAKHHDDTNPGYLSRRELGQGSSDFRMVADTDYSSRLMQAAKRRFLGAGADQVSDFDVVRTAVRQAIDDQEKKGGRWWLDRWELQMAVSMLKSPAGGFVTFFYKGHKVEIGNVFMGGGYGHYIDGKDAGRMWFQVARPVSGIMTEHIPDKIFLSEAQALRAIIDENIPLP